jgi:type IV pilus assembly protein PilV
MKRCVSSIRRDGPAPTKECAHERRQRLSLIEVLVTIGILWSFWARGPADQRHDGGDGGLPALQALVLVQDLPTGSPPTRRTPTRTRGTTSAYVDTTPARGIRRSRTTRCEWGNKLNGAAEVTGGGAKVGAMIGARGCVTEPTPNYYMITVAWQGMSHAGFGTAGATCGSGSYGLGLRRTVSVVVRVGLLGTAT